MASLCRDWNFCAAVLAVEIGEIVCENLNMNMNTKSVSFYTDSKVVLGYIYNETRRFYIYVENRINKIRHITNPSQWRYVRTDLNPADQDTRPVPVSYKVVLG